MTWERSTLGEIASWSSGGTPSAGTASFYGGDIPWLLIGDLNDGAVTTPSKTITGEGLANSSAKWVPQDAVLVAMYGSIGKLGLTQFPVTTNQAIAAAVSKGRVVPKFLFYYLLSQRSSLAAAGKGATQKNIGQGTLKAWPIYFPSALDEQRRIVELVEEQLSHLDAADAALATSKERANKLWGVTASQLLSQADHSLTPLQELLREPMRNGRSDRASANGEGIRCLTLTAVTRREFSDRWTKIAATAERTAAGLWLEPGDIFVQRSNTPELVGTSALYEGERHWAIFPDLLIRVRPDEKRVDRHFLAAALRSEACHRQLRKSAKGLAGSMPKIDQSALGRLPIPVPAMEQQKAIASQLMELEIDVLRMAHAIEAQSARCAALRRAVLAAAFSGRLTGSSSDTEIIEATAAAFPSPAQETLL